MAKSKVARQVSLGRQYAELDHLLSQINAAVKTAESILQRGVSVEMDVYAVVETLRMSRDLVRFAVDDTGKLIDDEAGRGE